MIARQLLFLFSALGAVNGLFTAFYLFGRRSRRPADIVLAALLLAVGVRTLKSALLFFNPSIALEFRQLGLSACLMIGPLTWLYVHDHLADLMLARPRIRWRRHIGLCVALIGIGIAFPYAAYPHFWDKSSHGIHAFWLCYLLAAGKVLHQHRALLVQPGRALSRHTLLLASVYLGSWLILLAYATVALTSYIVGALSFTFSLHIAVLVFLLRPMPSDAGNKYGERKLTHDDAAGILDTLDGVMREQTLYLDPNLGLAQLARRAGLTQAAVSQALNDRRHKSVHLYINEFRIDEARTLLAREPQLTLDIVAERCGFNASSTFFATFKKIVGRTPARFRADCTPG